jgi:hypothetical protein
LRGARLAGGQLDIDRAKARAKVTSAIAVAFPLFEYVRDLVVSGQGRELVSPAAKRLLDELCIAGIVVPNNNTFHPSSTDAKRYLRGGWLEEHVGLSALAAGADEVLIGPKVCWNAGKYRGENEIDTIARFGERLIFVSAKALYSRLGASGSANRQRLISALYEANNLIEHFGTADSAVALVTSTDLWDEGIDQPRYEQLFGKAAALNVELISLESLEPGALASRLAKLAQG